MERHGNKLYSHRHRRFFGEEDTSVPKDLTDAERKKRNKKRKQQRNSRTRNKRK